MEDDKEEDDDSEDKDGELPDADLVLDIQAFESLKSAPVGIGEKKMDFIV